MNTVDFIKISIKRGLSSDFMSRYDVIVTQGKCFYKVHIIGPMIGGSLIDFVRDNYQPFTIVITPADEGLVKLTFKISCTKE